MLSLFTIVSIFLALVIVGLWYNKIIPPTRSLLKKLITKSTKTANMDSESELSKKGRVRKNRFFTYNFKIFNSLPKIGREILTGVILVSFGTLIHVNETPTIYGYPLNKATGTLFIISGVFWILYVIENRKKLIDSRDRTKELERIYICPNCLKPEYAKDIPNLICEACQKNLEELDGFYERHPEFKEET